MRVPVVVDSWSITWLGPRQTNFREVRVIQTNSWQADKTLKALSISSLRILIQIRASTVQIQMILRSSIAKFLLMEY